MEISVAIQEAVRRAVEADTARLEADCEEALRLTDFGHLHLLTVVISDAGPFPYRAVACLLPQAPVIEWAGVISPAQLAELRQRWEALQ